MLESFLQSVHRTVLPNGLTLLTREHPGGVVAINTWVKAGYFHEADEVAGMAHLFEHMFFKGSKNFPGTEEISRHISALGGVTNAGTIYDSTNYYFVVPREGFTKAVEIQADAILHPLFDPAELIKEAEVVIEESNRKLDSPAAVATERMFARAFTQHRMRRWRIGSNEVLRNIQRQDLLTFFESLYRPENIIVSIVGDVLGVQALETVEKTFGKLDRGTLVKRRGPAEPEQHAFRFDESRGDIRQSYTVFGWHTPGERHPDEEALELLGGILGSGRHSRLYRGVVGRGAATSISASSSTFEDVGVFTIRASGSDASIEQIERRVVREIEMLKSFGPTEFELQMMRNAVESGLAFELEGVLGQAQTLSHHESRGSFRDIERRVRVLERVSVEDVQRVARHYLNISNLTLYRYRPSGVQEAEEVSVLDQIVSATESAVPVAPETNPIPASPQFFARASARREVQRFVLSNGIILFVREVPGTATVSTSILFKGGRLRETTANAGITQLMGRSMRRGTRSRSAKEIDREIEFLGTQLGLSFDSDAFGFSLDILHKYYDSGLRLLADVLSNPIFPAEGVEEERHLQLAAIERALDSSGERPFQLFHAALYGDHPYALPGSGLAGSVAGLQRDDLFRWYEETVVADAALMVVAGDVAAEDVAEVAEQELGNLRRSGHLAEAIPAFTPPAATVEVVESRERKQTAIVIGFPAVPPEHPDWIVLRLLQDVTSGLSGTFFAELRGRRSLAYTVFTSVSGRQRAGAFLGYIASEAAKEKESREGLLTEMRNLRGAGVSSADLERAKAYMAGTTRIRLQTNGALAGEIAQNYLLGLGLDFTERMLARIRTISVDEMRTIAQKYLSGDNYVVAILRGEGKGFVRTSEGD